MTTTTDADEIRQDAMTAAAAAAGLRGLLDAAEPASRSQSIERCRLARRRILGRAMRSPKRSDPP